jgi:hypothetical protein
MRKKQQDDSIWKEVLTILGVITLVFILGLLVVNQSTIQSSNENSLSSSYKRTYSNLYSNNNEYESYGNAQEISINGISMKKTLNYPSQTINLDLNGIDNVITVTKHTIISEVDLNGADNTLNLCTTHSPSIYENGINNDINYLNC